MDSFLLFRISKTFDRNFLVLIISVALNFCFLTANGQTLLTGQITDNEKQSVAGALVMILDETERVFASEFTDSTGVFSLTMPTAELEKYKFYISCFGYGPQKFTLKEAQNQKSFALENIVHELDEVIVAANRPAIKREMDKFVVPQIYQSPLAQGKSIVDFLKFAPLINVSQDDVLSILNKGAAIIYVNGRRSSIDLKSLPAENIEKVEIIPYPGSEYRTTDKSRGIINIILRKPPEDGIMASVSISDMQKEKWELNSPSLSIFFNIQKKKINITTGFSTYYRPSYSEETGIYNYYSEDLDMNNKINHNSSYYGLGTYLNLDYHINKKHTFGFRVSSGVINQKENNIAETNFRALNSNIIDSSDVTNTKLKMTNPNYSVSGNLNYNIKFNDKQTITFDLDYYHSQSDLPYYYKIEKTKNQIVEFSEFRTEASAITNGYNFATRFQHQFNSEMQLKAGMECYGAQRDNDYFFGNKINSIYISDTLQTNRFIFKDITSAAYIDFDWEITDELSLSAGLRGEYYTYEGNQKTYNQIVSNQHFNLSPSISLYYELHDDHELGFDFTTSYEPPGYYYINPFKTYYSPTLYKESNPDLQPYQEYEFALDYTFFSDYMLVFEYCYTKNTWSDFKIPMGNGITKIKPINYGRDYDFSVNFYVNKNMFKNFLILSFSQYFNYFAIKDIPNEIIAFNETGHSYKTILNINTALNKKQDWRFETQFHFIPKSEGVASNLKALYLLSANFSKKLKNGNLSFGVRNIIYTPMRIYLNSENYSFMQEFNNFGRTYILTYNIRFGNNKSRGTQNRESNRIQNRIQE